MNSSLTALKSAIGKLLPGDTGEEIKNNIDATLHSHFEQMNLATRDQLEIQEKVLRRSRERIAVLEQQVAELEKQLQNKERQ